MNYIVTDIQIDKINHFSLDQSDLSSIVFFLQLGHVFLSTAPLLSSYWPMDPAAYITALFTQLLSSLYGNYTHMFKDCQI